MGRGQKAGGIFLWPEQPYETFLLEVAVCGERLGDAPAPHKQKADGVANGVGLIKPILKKRQRVAVKSLVHPDDFDVSIVLKIGQK